MTNERVKPQTPDLPQTHPRHDSAWASYWQEKSRWQEQQIERLRAQLQQVDPNPFDDPPLCSRCHGTKLVTIHFPGSDTQAAWDADDQPCPDCSFKEYEMQEKEACEHGVWPAQRCEDCEDDERPNWW